MGARASSRRAVGCPAEQLREVMTGLFVTLAMRRVTIAATQLALPVPEDLRGLDDLAFGPPGDRDNLANPALAPVIGAQVHHQIH